MVVGDPKGGAPIRRRRPECVPLEAQVLVEDWRIEDNTVRPQSALGRHWSRAVSGSKPIPPQMERSDPILERVWWSLPSVAHQDLASPGS